MVLYLAPCENEVIVFIDPETETKGAMDDKTFDGQ